MSRVHLVDVTGATVKETDRTLTEGSFVKSKKRTKLLKIEV